MGLPLLELGEDGPWLLLVDRLRSPFKMAHALGPSVLATTEVPLPASQSQGADLEVHLASLDSLASTPRTVSTSAVA